MRNRTAITFLLVLAFAEDNVASDRVGAGVDRARRLRGARIRVNAHLFKMSPRRSRGFSGSVAKHLFRNPIGFSF